MLKGWVLGFSPEVKHEDRCYLRYPYNLLMIKKAVKVFNRQGVEMVIHAGDFIAPFSLGPLKGLTMPFIGVFGNCDGERKGLFEGSGGKIFKPPKEIDFGGYKIIILHDIKRLRGAKADLIVHGHLHKPIVEKKDNSLIVNPGESGGWLTGRATVAIVFLEEMSAEIVGL